MNGKEREPARYGLRLLIDVRKEKRTEFLQMYEMISGAPDDPEGRLSRVLYEEVAESNRFLWTERWRDASSLDRYMASERYLVLLGAIDVLGNLLERELFPITNDTQQDKEAKE